MKLRAALRPSDISHPMEIPPDWTSENQLLPEEPMTSTKSDKLFVKMQLGFHTDANGERKKSIEFKTYNRSTEGQENKIFYSKI